ncbi:MAG: GNAT family N-acetyltransferase [Aquiluna sp.]|nr:GNAT family N-acetyltransferase [Aquiluna sp.]MCF8545989.1 GNAT family N-acetyltransferase [Aquiluna sp.]
MISIATSRLILRPLESADAPQMLPYFSDPECCKYIPWEPRDLSGVNQFLDKWAAVKVPQADGESLILGIELPGAGIIGQLNLTLKSTANQQGEFGYILNRDHWGQGYASEAVAGFVDWAFDSIPVHRISAYVDSRNASSIKLLEKLDFSLEGTFVENEFFKGEWVTMLTFATLKRHWLKAN